MKKNLVEFAILMTYSSPRGQKFHLGPFLGVLGQFGILLQNVNKYKQTAISQELSMVDKFRLHIFSSHKVPKLWVK